MGVRTYGVLRDVGNLDQDLVLVECRHWNLLDNGFVFLGIELSGFSSPHGTGEYTYSIMLNQGLHS
jgi:hypothetical protein